MRHTKVWHERFSHRNLASLKDMQKSKMIVDLPEIVDLPDVCEVCVMGRHHQQPFPKQDSRAKAS